MDLRIPRSSRTRSRPSIPVRHTIRSLSQKIASEEKTIYGGEDSDCRRYSSTSRDQNINANSRLAASVGNRSYGRKGRSPCVEDSGSHGGQFTQMYLQAKGAEDVSQISERANIFKSGQDRWSRTRTRPVIPVRHTVRSLSQKIASEEKKIYGDEDSDCRRYSSTSRSQNINVNYGMVASGGNRSYGPKGRSPSVDDSRSHGGQSTQRFLQKKGPPDFSQLSGNYEVRANMMKSGQDRWSMTSRERDFRANRYAGNGGDSMKSLIYGQETPAVHITQNSRNRGFAGAQALQRNASRVTQRTNLGRNAMENITYKENSGTPKDDEYVHQPIIKNMSNGNGSNNRGRLNNATKNRPKKQFVTTSSAYGRNVDDDPSTVPNSGFGRDKKRNIECGDSQAGYNPQHVQPRRRHEEQNINVYHAAEQSEEHISVYAEFATEVALQRNVLIPYNFLNQFSPDFDDNIERTAVYVKHGDVLDCTCYTAHQYPEDELEPCAKHIQPDDLQFFPEACEVIETLHAPENKLNEKTIQQIEKHFQKKYPNYYDKFVNPLVRHLPSDFELKERNAKLEFVTCFQKLLKEEDNFLKQNQLTRTKRNFAVTGRMKDLNHDFETAYNVMKDQYPALYVLLLEKCNIAWLAFEKKVVEQNRVNLIQISNQSPQKLQRLEDQYKLQY